MRERPGQVAVNCGPVFDYGTSGRKWAIEGYGYDSMINASPDGDVALELGHHSPACWAPAATAARHSRRGSPRSPRCPWGGAAIPADQDGALEALNTTVDYWRDRLSAAKISYYPAGSRTSTAAP